MGGLTAAYVQTGGAKIDTLGFNVAIDQALLADPSPSLPNPFWPILGVGLTKTGSGQLTLRGATTFTGPTLVTEGTLAIAGSATLGSSARVSVAYGAKLDVTEAAGGSFSVGLGKTLANNGVVTGNVTVRGALTGAGTINGAVAIGSGGVLAPGEAIGTETVSGSLTLDGGSRYIFNLSSATATIFNGQQEFVKVNGAMSLTAAEESKFTLKLASVDSSGMAAPLGNFNPNQPYSFTIATATAGIAGFEASAVIVDSSAFQNNTGGGAFSVAQQGNSLVVQFTPAAVPEPGVAGLIAVGVLGVSLRRLRRGSRRQGMAAPVA